MRLETISIDGINDGGDWVSRQRIQFADGRTFFIDRLPGHRSAAAFDINDQGTVIGESVWRFFSACHSDQEATVWTVAGGTLGLDTHLGVPAADVASAINDHNEIVGMRSFSGRCGDYEAFYFSFDTREHIDLHALVTGGAYGGSEAHGINDLGVVTGQWSDGVIGAAWTWSRAEGFTFLPGLEGGDPRDVRPSAISNDGEVVGAATTAAEGRRAFIWSEAGGMRDLNDLVELPAGLVLDRATRINDDGWIVGNGHWGAPAWGPAVGFVLIPRDGACRVDLDGDGELTFFDFLAFQNLFAAGDPRADFTGDGVLDFFDFLAFQNEFAAGCP